LRPMPAASRAAHGYHVCMQGDGSPSLTFNYDQMVDVPHHKGSRALERLSPTMHPTSQGIFPSPYKYPKNMQLRGPLRGCRPVQEREQIGSDHFESTIVGRKERKGGEDIQHFKAKRYDATSRCRRDLDILDTIPGDQCLKRQHLPEYAAAIKVPVAAPTPGIKPKNMKHPGLVLPPGLTTTQCLFTFNPQKTGTPMRLQSVASRISPDIPRFVTHDFTSMSPAVQANYRKTQSMLFPRSESVAGEYSTEYKRRFQSGEEKRAKTPQNRPRNASSSMQIGKGSLSPSAAAAM